MRRPTPLKRTNFSFVANGKVTSFYISKINGIPRNSQEPTVRSPRVAAHHLKFTKSLRFLHVLFTLVIISLLTPTHSRAFISAVEVSICLMTMKITRENNMKLRIGFPSPQKPPDLIISFTHENDMEICSRHYEVLAWALTVTAKYTGKHEEKFDYDDIELLTGPIIVACQ